MVKRALCVIAAVATVATASTLAVSPSSASVARSAAPRNGRTALKILRADVMKLARHYSHKRYRAVCSDLTKSERTRLGGMTTCTYKIALIHLLVPIKKFTITAAKLNRAHLQASVSLYINGNKRHRIHAVAKWEGGAYRLDHQSGWKPKL